MTHLSLLFLLLSHQMLLQTTCASEQVNLSCSKKWTQKQKLPMKHFTALLCFRRSSDISLLPRITKTERNVTCDRHKYDVAAACNCLHQIIVWPRHQYGRGYNRGSIDCLPCNFAGKEPFLLIFNSHIPEKWQNTNQRYSKKPSGNRGSIQLHSTQFNSIQSNST